MKNNKIFKTLIIFLILFSAILGCSRNQSKENLEEKLPAETEAKEEDQTNIKIDKQVYEEELKRTVEEIGIIHEFTPESFIKITILNKKMTRLWLDESMALSPDEQKEYLDLQNQLFFNEFGTTEEQFIKYSKENIEALNKYMETHPELIPELQKY